MEPISKFHNLSRLEVSFSSDLLLQVLPNFLEISPNLKYLTLVKSCYKLLICFFFLETSLWKYLILSYLFFFFLVAIFWQCLVFSTKIERENLELSNAPRCLLSTLECVEIKEMIAGEETGMARVRIAKTTAMKLAKQKKKIWMEVVRYFLEDSVVLKNLILCLTDSDITKKLVTFTKRFGRCQTIFR